MPLMEENVKLNGLGNVKAAVLDWGEETLPTDTPSRPDVVLLADCVYFEPAFPLLGASSCNRPPGVRLAADRTPFFSQSIHCSS